MCGIIGLVGDVARDRFDLALSRISHRGPDGQGVYVGPGGSVLIGHRRLAIIDTTAGGHQPMVSRCGRFVISFNGEIYNYRELRRDAESRGSVFTSSSDTEVLLELFARQGESCIPRLNGMYAFAIFDVERRRLFVVRDPWGIKPLYYFQAGERFGFASEIKALVPLMKDSPTIDPAAIHRYLHYLWCPGSGTPLREVRKVRPGEIMEVDATGRVVGRRFPRHETDVASTRADAVVRPEDVLAALDESVQRQLVSDVPVGSFLSGGLDSSAVVALASKHHPGISCYTIDQEGGADAGVESDLPFAKDVAAHLSVPLKIVRMRAVSLQEELPGLVAQLDEPQADPAALAVREIARVAREDGIKVLLSGIGGDDLFAGYRRHQVLYWSAQLELLPKWLRTGAQRLVGRMDHRRAWVRQLARLNPGSLSKGRDQMLGLFGWLSSDETSRLFAPGIREQIQHDPVDRPFRDFLEEMPDDTEVLRQCLALEQEFFLPDHNLAYADKMSMQAGVETRVPILDARLVSLSRSLRRSELMKRGVPKYLLKSALRGVLPDRIIDRKKVGFGAPVRRWVREDLRDMVHDCLSADSLRSRGLFEAGRVAELIRRNERGEIDGAYTILALICVELWCRAYIDGEFSWRSQP